MACISPKTGIAGNIQCHVDGFALLLGFLFFFFFGLGPGRQLALGYTFSPFGNRGLALLCRVQRILAKFFTFGNQPREMPIRKTPDAKVFVLQIID